MSRWILLRIGTNHSSHAEKSWRNKFALLFKVHKWPDLNLIIEFFVCATLISVKSKYSSCSGSCTGFIKLNKKKQEGSVCRSDGWTISITFNRVRISNLQIGGFLPPTEGRSPDFSSFLPSFLPWPATDFVA